MSSGQRPRWPEFYPRMKNRARKRRSRRTRIILWDSDFRAVWPQALKVDGKEYPLDKCALIVDAGYGERTLDRDTGYWVAGRVHA